MQRIQSSTESISSVVSLSHEGSNPTDGTRIDRYADSNEICEQRLVLRTDPDIIYVFIGPHVATLTYAPMLGVAINQLVLRNRHEPRLRLIVKRFS